MWKKSEDLHPKLLKCLHLGSLCLSAASWLRGSRPQGYLRIQGGDWRSIHHIWVPNCAKEERKKEGSMNILLAESPSLQQSFQESHMYPLCCSVAKSCPTLCDPMDCSTPGFPVLHYFPEFAQIHLHWVNDGIQRELASYKCFRTRWKCFGSVFQERKVMGVWDH